jgi:hypothetical protein
MKYEEMTVKELREISKGNGLTLEHKGHKFTKPELIERLKQYDGTQADINKAIEEAGETTEPVEIVEENEEWDAPLLQENKEENKKVDNTIDAKEETNVDNGFIYFAETIEQLEEKYGKRKKEYVYDEILNVGSFVAFVEYVEALNGGIYKKLRTAKVIKISRKRQIVRVQKVFGDVLDLDFEQLLFIRKPEEYFPKDVTMYLRKQRYENRERRARYENKQYNSVN